MTLPLYTDHGAPEKHEVHYNTGLWYDKFFRFWKSNADWTVSEDGKKKWIQGICAAPVGDKNLLKGAVSRLVEMVYTLRGEICCFATDWRFVTGLGREHPVENGFAWHHTLGVPFLPGSSVKGIVRAWVEKWADPPVSPADVRRVFGPEGEGRDRHVGSIIFFDALPVKPVKLEADVMTPHYVPYYQQDRPENPPGDWYGPVPIPFLTVKSGQTFLFALAPRRAAAEQSYADCQQAVRWLTQALADIGAGAKTAVGYGRFVRREKTEDEIRGVLAGRVVTTAPAAEELGSTPTEKAVSTAELSSIRKEMEASGYSHDPECFMGVLTTFWLKKLQDDQIPLDERKEIALLLKEWYLVHKAGQWRKPNKKNKAKIAEIKKVLGE
jgi:CRISPR-associated protein Cmr6